MNDDLKLKADKLRTSESDEQTPQQIVSAEPIADAHLESEHQALHLVRPAAPCGIAWSDMQGDDCKRQCKVCGFDVFKLPDESVSSLTTFIQSTRPDHEHPFYRRSDGTYMSRDCFRARFYPRLIPATVIFFAGLIAFVVLLKIALTTLPSLLPNFVQSTCPLELKILLVAPVVALLACGSFLLARTRARWMPAFIFALLIIAPIAITPIYLNEIAEKLAPKLAPAAYANFLDHYAIKQLEPLNSYSYSDPHSDTMPGSPQREQLATPKEKSGR